MAQKTNCFGLHWIITFLMKHNMPEREILDILFNILKHLKASYYNFKIK